MWNSTGFPSGPELRLREGVCYDKNEALDFLTDVVERMINKQSFLLE
jgi:hypothetical protein